MFLFPQRGPLELVVHPDNSQLFFFCVSAAQIFGTVLANAAVLQILLKVYFLDCDAGKERKIKLSFNISYSIYGVLCFFSEGFCIFSADICQDQPFICKR